MYYEDDGFEGVCMAPGCTVEILDPEGSQRRRQPPGMSDAKDGRTIRPQRRTCSDRCRKALSRSRRAKPQPLRDCKLCGQPFLVRGRGNPTTCPYDDADDFCQGLQDEADDAQSMRLADLADAVCQGPDCEEPIPYSGRGRPPKFCSPRCRTRARRAAQEGA